MYPVLIVEDEPILLNGLAKLVEDSAMGFAVSGKAANGAEAVEMIATLAPALVITDIRMPRMDGLELTAWIHREQPEIKTIIVTVYSDFSFAQQAIRLGVADFLLKPVKKEELHNALAKVKTLLDDRLAADSSVFFAPELNGLFEAIVQAVQLLDSANAAQAADRFCDLLCQSYHFPWHFQLQLIVSVFENLHKQFPDVTISSDMTWSDGLFALHVKDQQQLRQYFGAQIALFVAKLATQRGSVGRQAISKAKEFIESRYASDIGLKDVAEAVYLNPSYFSQIFKDTTGENFINYLTRVRVEKAASMLQQSELKIYEVAKAVGYSDQAYFSRIFKQLMGVNPIDYRRRLGI